MICQVVRRSLLEAEDPGSPPRRVLAHLADCPSCMEWQRRLIQVEWNIPRLPVPATSARAALVHRLLTAPAADLVPHRRAAGEDSTSKIESRGWKRVALALRSAMYRRRFSGRRLALAGVAAAGLLVVLGWWLLPGRNPPPVADVARTAPPAADPLVARLVQRDLSLAEANTPRQRVEALADLADDLHAETRTLARTAPGEDLLNLARLYQRVVREGVVKQARIVPAVERSLVLAPIGDRLAWTERDARQLARDVPGAADPLRLIAEAAREGGDAIRPRRSETVTSRARPVRPLPGVQVEQLRRNRVLIQSLVDGSLCLASADDPLRRADCCNGLAGRLAGAVGEAAVNRDGARAAELGQHVQALLDRGVAANLNTALRETPASSERTREMHRLAGQAARVVQPVERQLERAALDDPEEMGHALQSVQGGWAEVQKALQGSEVKDLPGKPE